MKPGDRVRCISYVRPKSHLVGKYGTLIHIKDGWFIVDFDADYAPCRTMSETELELVK